MKKTIVVIGAGNFRNCSLNGKYGKAEAQSR